MGNSQTVDQNSNAADQATLLIAGGDFRNLPSAAWAKIYKRFEVEKVKKVAALPAPSTPSDAPTKRPSHSKLNFRNFLQEHHGQVFDYYEKLGDLGEGAFGDVWLARERVRAGSEGESKGRKVAVKRIRKPNSQVGLDEEGADSEEAIVDFRTEVELMKALDHPNCCRLLEVFEDAKNLFLVMEYVNGAELFERISEADGISEHDAAAIVRQTASALAYCHAHGVVHRDIKPENILLADLEEDQVQTDTDGHSSFIWTVKVIDFGFGSRILRGGKIKAKVGTFLYTAPEALKDEPCDEGVDNWALGCVLFALLSGNSPFYGPNCRESIVQGKFSMEGPEWKEVSEGAKELVKGLLAVEPSQRTKAAEVLVHPWVSSNVPAHSPKKDRLSLDSLKDFHRESCFRRLCTGILARQLDEGQLHQLHQTFESLDTDGDGILTVSELRQVCSELDISSPDEMQELFADVDMDASGSVDYTEFIAACLDKRTKQQEEACWTAFRTFDENGDGRVSYKELRHVVSSSAVQGCFSEEALNVLWRELTGADLSETSPTNLEGEVDFDHFLLVLGNAEAQSAASKRSKSGPLGTSSAPATGLPVPSRHRGSLVSSLPIAGRSRLQAAAPTTMATPALPIPSSRKTQATPSGPTLPLFTPPSRASGTGETDNKQPGGSLPIPPRGGSGGSGGGGMGLPIANKHRH